MTATPNPTPQAQRGTPAAPPGSAGKTRARNIPLTRLRNAAIVALFACALLVPKIIHLRRNERSWFAFRVALAIVGASLVLLPLALWDSYLLSVVGLAMFITAILLPSARPDTTADEKARELGALVVVNGGEYQPGNAPAARVQFFTGVENIWALDKHLQPLLVIPVRELTTARAESAAGVWYLRLEWADHSAEFSYRGIFAEHLARVAESTLHSVMRPALPVLPQRRAASA
ncbi:MAG: hypothetical protein ABSG16_08085 [Candidatus Acidiferrum sp.]|jgi:hypothetical protein